MTNETKARLKIMVFTMISAGVWVYWLKIPYLAFLFGAITMKWCQIMWEDMMDKSDNYVKVVFWPKGIIPKNSLHDGVEIVEKEENGFKA